MMMIDFLMGLKFLKWDDGMIDINPTIINPIF